MPLRKELQPANTLSRPGRAAGDPLRILVMGGSRGARVLNEVVPRAVADAVGKGVSIEVEHIAGLHKSEEVEAIYAAAGVKGTVHHFVRHMETIYPAVDFAICRSGAATCAELACYALPALLIPYPLAVRDHQMGNARVLQDMGAVDVVAQEDLSGSWLCDYLVSVSRNPDRLKKMAAAMQKRAQPNAAARLADLLEKVGGAHP
jgi:UDP-N-acetylglucosamine--N-acetylmuramyl-(pentapeptide) pyrophosphoryl-undecaprenol N-acetylglucosamine transferase